jgi:hypothetical protein
MFKSLYDSPLVATLLPCIASACVIVWALTKKSGGGGFVRVYGCVFALAIAADAYLNGPWSPLKSGTTLAAVVGVLFVIVGDFRYFVLIEESLHHAYKSFRAAIWALIVPAVAQIVRWKLPKIESDERSTFLVYELLFFVLAIAIRTFVATRARATKDRALARAATTFELVQYGIWIVADVGLMVTNLDAFYGVRLTANLLYYVAFVPTMMKLLEERDRDAH